MQTTCSGKNISVFTLRREDWRKGLQRGVRKCLDMMDVFSVLTVTMMMMMMCMRIKIYQILYIKYMSFIISVLPQWGC